MQGRITNIKFFNGKLLRMLMIYCKTIFSHFTAHMNDLAKTIDFCRKSGTVNGFPF